MERRPLLLDCDPGQDDAVAILLTLASPDELELLGITTVAGNVPLEKTQRNARLMCDVAGREDVPVYPGCPRPLVRELYTAEYVHGKEGIDGAEIREPRTPRKHLHAVDFLVSTLSKAADDSVTLAAVGPLTNVAAALVKAPELAAKLSEIVIMGGAMREGGNTTPSAEFNRYVDPHAAKVVYDCGRPITVMGLDVTHQVLATPRRVARIEEIGTPVASTVAAMLRYFNRYDVEKYGTEGAPLHDPCTIAYLLEPRLFRGKHVRIDVETASELTMGATAVDFWGVTDKRPNATWMHEVDAEGFFDLLTRRLARLR